MIARNDSDESGELTDLERALMAEIAAAEARIGPALDVDVPAGALHRVGARLAAASGARRGPRRWLAWTGAAAAAAIAVAACLWLAPRPTERRAQLTPGEYVVRFVQASSDPLDLRVQMLGEELADYHVAMALGDDWPLDMAFLAFEDAIEQAILEDQPLGSEDDWPIWEDAL